MMNSPSLRTIPPSERPRERCLSQGARCLSLRECLALIIGSGPEGRGALGTARALLEKPGWECDQNAAEQAFFTAMESAGSSHLKGVHGLGESGQARILAAFELGRRYAAHREHTLVTNGLGRMARDLPDRALSRIPADRRLDSKEWLAFCPVQGNGKLGDFHLVEHGVRTHVNVDPASLFTQILSLRPRAFFLFHNHPSGSLFPSPQDLHLTDSVKQIAQGLGLGFLGHAIVTPRGEHWIVL